MIDIFSIISLAIIFNFPHFYGAAENRLFKEHGETLPGNHFKVYHLWLFLLSLGSAVIFYALARSLLLTLSYIIYFPFGLDWVWWIIRYYDFKKDYAKAVEEYSNPGFPPETSAWHLKSDWDNYLGLPLVFGVYWWWYLLGVLSLACGLCFVFW